MSIHINDFTDKKIESLDSFVTFAQLSRYLEHHIIYNGYIIEETNRLNSMDLFKNKSGSYLVLKKTDRKCPKINDIIWKRCKTKQQWIKSDEELDEFLKDKTYINDGGSCIFYKYNNLYYKVVNRSHFIKLDEYNTIREKVNKTVIKEKGNLMLSKLFNNVKQFNNVDIYEVEYYDKDSTATVKDIIIMLLALLDNNYMVNDVHPRNIKMKDGVNYYLDICDVKPYSRRYWNGFKSYCKDVDKCYNTNIFTILSTLEFDKSSDLSEYINEYVLIYT